MLDQDRSKVKSGMWAIFQRNDDGQNVPIRFSYGTKRLIDVFDAKKKEMLSFLFIIYLGISQNAERKNVISIHFKVK